MLKAGMVSLAGLPALASIALQQKNPDKINPPNCTTNAPIVEQPTLS